MDTVLPDEMEPSDISAGFTLNELENYASLYLCTEKWHRYTWGKKTDKMLILSRKNKQLLKGSQLANYYEQLLNFYFYTRNMENNAKRKIRRLSEKQENSLSDDELVIYLKQLRKKDDKSHINNLRLSIRKRIIPLFRIILMLNAMWSRIRIEELNCKLPDSNGRPIIFVFTHVGKEDQVVFSHVIKNHYTILSGDYESLHNNVEGVICKINGILFFDMQSKKERGEVEDRVEDILKAGDNIMCSMEAAWNLSPNIPVQELFSGMIRSAIRTNAVIMPIGIERFNKKLYGINVCHSYFDPMIYVGKYSCERKMIDKARGDLREQLADIKMQLYFAEGIRSSIKATRGEIGNYEEYNKNFKKDILEGWTFTEEIIREKKYINRNAPEEVFKYVIKRYSKLTLFYSESKSSTLSIESRNQTKERFKKLLVELVLDVKNPTYPNVIHNQLLAILERWNEMNVQ